MVDYVPYEVVSYVDNEPSGVLSYDTVYPDELNYNSASGNFFRQTDFYTLYYTVEVPFDFVPDNFNWSNMVDPKSPCYKFTLTGFRQVNNGYTSEYFEVDYIYSGYYFLEKLEDGVITIGNITLYRCPFELIPENPPQPQKKDIYWLYDIGISVVYLGSGVVGLLNYEIGGFSVMSLLFTTTIFLYFGWAIIKWFIPL